MDSDLSNLKRGVAFSRRSMLFGIALVLAVQVYALPRATAGLASHVVLSVAAVGAEAAPADRPAVAQKVAVTGKLYVDDSESDPSGRPPLHLAAQAGAADSARALLAGGAGVDRIDNAGVTPLISAARSGSVEVVRLLLEYHATVDALDGRGSTALHWAAQYGYEDVIRALLEAGANVNAANRANVTPLHFAYMYGRPGAAQLLIDHGADITVRNIRGKTPLDTRPALNLNIPAALLEERGVFFPPADPYRALGVNRAKGDAWNFIRVASYPRTASDAGITAKQRTAIEQIFTAGRKSEDQLPRGKTVEEIQVFNTERAKIWNDLLPQAKAELNAEQIGKVETWIRERDQKQVQEVKRRARVAAQARAMKEKK